MESTHWLISFKDLHLHWQLWGNYRIFGQSIGVDVDISVNINDERPALIQLVCEFSTPVYIPIQRVAAALSLALDFPRRHGPGGILNSQTDLTELKVWPMHLVCAPAC